MHVQLGVVSKVGVGGRVELCLKLLHPLYCLLHCCVCELLAFAGNAADSEGTEEVRRLGGLEGEAMDDGGAGEDTAALRDDVHRRRQRVNRKVGDRKRRRREVPFCHRCAHGKAVRVVVQGGLEGARACPPVPLHHHLSFVFAPQLALHALVLLVGCVGSLHHGDVNAYVRRVEVWRNHAEDLRKHQRVIRSVHKYYRSRHCLYIACSVCGLHFNGPNPFGEPFNAERGIARGIAVNANAGDGSFVGCGHSPSCRARSQAALEGGTKLVLCVNLQLHITVLHHGWRETAELRLRQAGVHCEEVHLIKFSVRVKGDREGVCPILKVRVEGAARGAIGPVAKNDGGGALRGAVAAGALELADEVARDLCISRGGPEGEEGEGVVCHRVRLQENLRQHNIALELLILLRVVGRVIG
mmetsp:Transcript_6751/g.18896  ORF Transcript_6751/g.18896 Transcript_6751/m.18896 type:complete len:413 (+) Transcript_6751:1183-2421(+)